jgi:hypothetical protein
MADFSAFRDPGRAVDQAVQLSLREVDPGPLAVAMLTMQAVDQEIIFRNMSARAADILKEDIAQLGRLKPGAYDTASTAKQEWLLRKFVKYLRYVEANVVLTPPAPPKVRWGREDELIQDLVALKRFASRHGAPSLEPLLDTKLHPLLEKGIRLYTEDWDPAAAQSVLEQLRESLVTRYRNMLDIMVEGVAALFGQDLPQVVEEKLTAFRLSDQGNEQGRGS